MEQNKDYFYKKIVILNLIATIFIVYLHSNPLLRFDLEISMDYPIIYGGYLLTQTAVPLFYFISGILFYKNQPHIWSLKNKLKKRFFSLFIPYIFWNTLWVLVFLTIAQLPFLSNQLNMGNPFHSIKDIAIAIIDSRFTPLWFIKVLMLYTVASYLILPLLHKKILFLYIILISFFIGQYFGIDKYDSPTRWLSIYLLGAYVGFNKYDEMKINYVATIFTTVAIVGLYFSVIFKPEWKYYFCLTFPIWLWYAYNNYISSIRSENIMIKPWMKYTFFIYCTHYFFINVIEKIIVRSFEPTIFVLNLTFLLTPIIVIICLCFIAKHLSKNRFYHIITGNR